MPTVRYTTGAYGHTVAVVDRGRGSLALRFRSGTSTTYKALGHADLRRASAQARELAVELAKHKAQQSGAPGARRDVSLRQLFAQYALRVSRHKRGSGPTEDTRRRKLWLGYLGDRPALHITPADVEEFAKLRAKGLVQVEGLDLTRTPKPRTVDADVVYLQSVYNWGYTKARLLESNPLRGVTRPEVSEQLRPMATWERVTQLLAVADRVHPRFRLLLCCARDLGWRISAVCAIQAPDIRRLRTEHAPHGSVFKNWLTDKEAVADWLPLTAELRQLFDDAGVIAGPVFPSPVHPDKPWSRFYARELLERAEKLAGLAPLEGGDWHPYRRLWATERKVFPVGDVAAAGGWKDRRTLEKYQQRDPATTAKIMLFTRETPTESEQSHPNAKPARKRVRKSL